MNDITHLVPFATALSKAVCNPRNTRLNNIAMLRALNAKSNPELDDPRYQLEIQKAYIGVLEVLTRAKLEILPEYEDPSQPLILTYERFKASIAICERHILILNS